MVKVAKVAVWKIGNTYIESAKEAEKETRRMVIQELIAEESPSAYADEADYFAHYWETIEARTKAAMTGT